MMEAVRTSETSVNINLTVNFMVDVCFSNLRLSGIVGAGLNTWTEKRRNGTVRILTV
jgi:hypothetical protein